MPPETIREMLRDSLPEDRSLDPVLLYGVRIPRRYEDFFRPEALDALRETLQGEEKLLVLGRGALCETLRGAYGTRVWVDITPRTAALNYKYGKAHNFGEPAARPLGP